LYGISRNRGGASDLVGVVREESSGAFIDSIGVRAAHGPSVSFAVQLRLRHVAP
jgi:hypothetical protein